MVDEQELPRLYLRFARANELLTLRLSEDKGGDILKEAGIRIGAARNAHQQEEGLADRLVEFSQVEYDLLVAGRISNPD